MKSTLAGVLAVTFHLLGFTLGCLIWSAVGYCLGSAFSDAPVTGALCGLTYQLACYVWLHDQMWDSLERAHQKFELVLDQFMA